MATTITNLKDLVAIGLGRTSATDLTINGVDYGIYALNAARRYIERAHDFKYAESDVYLSVPSTGGLITACYATSALTGTAIGVKRIDSILLPLTANSEYVPIEFLTNDAFVSRVRRAVGRAVFDATKTLAALGFSTENTLAYQNGQTIFLHPFTSTTTVRMNVCRWMPDYTTGSDTDFFTAYGPEVLQWAAVLEVNKYFRKFAEKQEGNIDEVAVKTMRDEALRTLIEWDVSIVRGTSTPNAKSDETQSQSTGGK